MGWVCRDIQRGSMVPLYYDNMDTERTVTCHTDTNRICLEIDRSGREKLFQYISKCYNKIFFN